MAKKWINYRSDQTVMGKKPVLLDWLKAEMKKYKNTYPLVEDYYGGKYKKKKKHNRTNKREKKYKKKKVKGTRRNKYNKKRNI